MGNYFLDTQYSYSSLVAFNLLVGLIVDPEPLQDLVLPDIRLGGGSLVPWFPYYWMYTNSCPIHNILTI